MKSGLHVKEIEDKTLLKAGRIHVAPADYHLLFEKDQSLALDVSEKVQYSRPSIDIAFESAAEAFGQKVIAVLLSGANSDGTDGLLAVKKQGGIVVIQSPVDRRCTVYAGICLDAPGS
jgi:two-component system chemotaxis response regulator CheB